MKKQMIFLLLAATGLIFASCYHHIPDDDKTPSDVAFTFQPPSFNRLCPTHVGGDREFKGHGPKVRTSATLELRNSNTEVWVKMFLNAKETRDDWTEAEGNWDRLLWQVPPGSTITSINSSMASQASYTDTDHSLDSPAVTGGSLVSRFEVMGDTGGNDVRNCTDDDVYLNVQFNPVSGMRTP
jgi:hypothetical protein